MVLPNRNTIGLAALLLAMWYAGASQSNSAAYLLGFVVTGLALVSILHAWANVRGITFTADPIAPVFAGEERLIRITARCRDSRGHPGLRVKVLGSKSRASFGEVAASTPQRTELGVTAPERGKFDTLELQLSTVFPLGFFTATQRQTIAAPHFVYPRAEGSLPLPRSHAPARRLREGMRVEGDDFAGTRSYQLGESQRHIDWKAAARGQPLLVKQWAGESDETIMLRWEDAASLPWEARLSQLARWVVLAERRGATYGLQLPGRTINPGRDEAHFHECLRALASFPREGEA